MLFPHNDSPSWVSCAQLSCSVSLSQVGKLCPLQNPACTGSLVCSPAPNILRRQCRDMQDIDGHGRPAQSDVLPH